MTIHSTSPPYLNITAVVWVSWSLSCWATIKRLRKSCNFSSIETSFDFPAFCSSAICCSNYKKKKNQDKKRKKKKRKGKKQKEVYKSIHKILSETYDIFPKTWSFYWYTVLVKSNISSLFFLFVSLLINLFTSEFLITPFLKSEAIAAVCLSFLTGGAPRLHFLENWSIRFPVLLKKKKSEQLR